MNYRGVRVVSFIPGRVRIKLGALMGEPGLVADLRSELVAIDGIEAIDLNKLTGSVAICYDRKALRTPRSMQALEEMFSRHFPGLDLAPARRWLQADSW